MSETQGADMDNDFMKSTDKNPSNIMPEKLTYDSPLQFECHPGVSCFTACCHNIKIVLTPYDIVRMKHRLGLTSDLLLRLYTEPELLGITGVPIARLKMLEKEEGRCPFVT